MLNADCVQLSVVYRLCTVVFYTVCTVNLVLNTDCVQLLLYTDREQLSILYRCVQRYDGHLNRAHPCHVVFSPCCRFIATGSEDRSVSFMHSLSNMILSPVAD